MSCNAGAPTGRRQGPRLCARPRPQPERLSNGLCGGARRRAQQLPVQLLVGRVAIATALRRERRAAAGHCARVLQLQVHLLTCVVGRSYRILRLPLWRVATYATTNTVCTTVCRSRQTQRTSWKCCRIEKWFWNDLPHATHRLGCERSKGTSSRPPPLPRRSHCRSFSCSISMLAAGLQIAAARADEPDTSRSRGRRSMSCAGTAAGGGATGRRGAAAEWGAGGSEEGGGGSCGGGMSAPLKCRVGGFGTCSFGFGFAEWRLLRDQHSVNEDAVRCSDRREYSLKICLYSTSHYRTKQSTL